MHLGHDVLPTGPPLVDPQTYQLIGAALAVHTELGCGFLEQVYQRAYAIELELRGIPYVYEAGFALHYRHRPLELRYRADFVCFDSVIVEVKALRAITTIEEAQAINYLRASGLHRALILNFGARRDFHHGLPAKLRLKPVARVLALEWRD